MPFKKNIIPEKNDILRCRPMSENFGGKALEVDYFKNYNYDFFQATIRCLSTGLAVFAGTLQLTEHMPKELFAVWICALFFFFCGMWAITPSVLAKLYGPKNMAVNYGFITSAVVSIFIKNIGLYIKIFCWLYSVLYISKKSKQGNKQASKQKTDMQTNRLTDRHARKQKTKTNRQTDGQKDRQRQASRQASRQANKQEINLYLTALGF